MCKVSSGRFPLRWQHYVSRSCWILRWTPTGAQSHGMSPVEVPDKERRRTDTVAVESVTAAFFGLVVLGEVLCGRFSGKSSSLPLLRFFFFFFLLRWLRSWLRDRELGDDIWQNAEVMVSSSGRWCHVKTLERKQNWSDLDIKCPSSWATTWLTASWLVSYLGSNQCGGGKESLVSSVSLCARFSDCKTSVFFRERWRTQVHSQQIVFYRPPTPLSKLCALRSIATSWSSSLWLTEMSKRVDAHPRSMDFLVKTLVILQHYHHINDTGRPWKPLRYACITYSGALAGGGVRGSSCRLP